MDIFSGTTSSGTQGAKKLSWHLKCPLLLAEKQLPNLSSIFGKIASVHFALCIFFPFRIKNLSMRKISKQINVRKSVEGMLSFEISRRT